MTRGTLRALLVPFIGLALLCTWVVLAIDHEEAAALWARAQWGLVIAAIACSFASYCFISAGLVLIGRTLGMRRVTAPMFMIVAFVSHTLNYVVSLGLADYSARVLLLRRAGEAPGTVLAASLLHAYLATLVMVSLLPIGLSAIAVSEAVPPAGTAALQVAAAIITALVLVMTVGLVSRRLRQMGLAVVGRVGRFIPGGHAEGIERALLDLDLGLATAFRAVRQQPAAALAPVVCALLDWTSVLAAYWFCLLAVGQTLELHVLIAGFAIGANAGIVLLVPGGLGVQEGSQAGVLAILGVPFGTALLASVLFRFVYFLLPLLISLPLYLVVLRPPAPAAEAPDPTPATAP